MKSFNKQNLQEVRVDITLALQEVAKKHGIQLAIGNISFSDTSFTAKMTALITDATEAPMSGEQVKWAKAFTNHAFSFGMQSSDLGKEVVLGSKTYTIAGARPRANRPIVLKTSTGVFHAFEAYVVKSALGK